MTAAKMHVKKGDKVLVLSGKDKGKEGKNYYGPAEKNPKLSLKALIK